MIPRHKTEPVNTMIDLPERHAEIPAVCTAVTVFLIMLKVTMQGSASRP
jgi:hypothetical protein